MATPERILLVFLDGVGIGRTPIKLEIPPGEHTLVLDDGKSEGRFTIDGDNLPDRMCFSVDGRRISQGTCK